MTAPSGSNARPIRGATMHERIPMTFFLQPKFGQQLRRCREHRKLHVRAASREGHIPAATWNRIELGGDTMVTTAIQLTIWMIDKGDLNELLLP